MVSSLVIVTITGIVTALALVFRILKLEEDVSTLSNLVIDTDNKTRDAVDRGISNQERLFGVEVRTDYSVQEIGIIKEKYKFLEEALKHGSEDKRVAKPKPRAKRVDKKQKRGISHKRRPK